MDNIVDQVYIINLDSRPDRMASMIKLMERLTIKHWTRFTAIRPSFKTIDPKLYEGYSRLHKLNKKYVKGSVGCKLSHIEVLKDAKQQGHKRILILEDDVEFTGVMTHIDLAVKEAENNFPEWDIIYLGLNKAKYVTISDLVFLNHVEKGLCTHAYIVNGNSYGKIIRLLEKSDKQIDITYQENFNKFLNAYIVPNQFKQGKSYSDINRIFR